MYPTYTEPLLPLFLLIGCGGLIAGWQRLGPKRAWLIATALMGVFLITWAPAAWLFALPLEKPYPRLSLQNPEARTAGAIVVLAANVEPARSHFPMAIPDTSTYARCRYAAWLYQNWRPIPVFVSGGNRQPGQAPFSAAMAHILAGENIPAEQIVEESQSVNTWENAVFTTKLLRARGIEKIVLIVEADSMMRAELCFRKLGITVFPAAISHRSVSWTARDLIPSWRALRLNEITLHEVVGLAWYRLKGRI